MDCSAKKVEDVSKASPPSWCWDSASHDHHRMPQSCLKNSLHRSGELKNSFMRLEKTRIEEKLVLGDAWA